MVTNYHYGNHGNLNSSSITVFSGRSAVELQRGWVINLGGEKMNITLDQSVRNGPMTVSFDGRNLRVKLDGSSTRVNQFLILIMKINLTF